MYLKSWSLEQQDELPGIPASATLHKALKDFNHFTRDVEHIWDNRNNHLRLIFQTTIGIWGRVGFAHYSTDFLVHPKQVCHSFGSQNLAEKVYVLKIISASSLMQRSQQSWQIYKQMRLIKCKEL
jgi:hypothetical protein